MPGLAERITQRESFRSDPERAAHLVHIIAGSKANPTDNLTRFVASIQVSRLLIELGQIFPATVFGVMFMGCNCPSFKPETKSEREQRHNNEHRKAARAQADIFFEEGIWSEKKREAELKGWDERHGY